MTAQVQSTGFSWTGLQPPDLAAQDVLLAENGGLVLWQQSLPTELFASLLLPVSRVQLGPRGLQVASTDDLELARLRRQLGEQQALQQEMCASAPAVCLRVVDPFSLVTILELKNGHRALTDHGAVVDIFAEYQAGILDFLAQIRAAAEQPVAVQVDSRHLDAVISGRVPGTHQFDQLRALPAPDVSQQLLEFFGGWEGQAQKIIWNVAGTTPAFSVLPALTKLSCPVQLLLQPEQAATSAAKDAVGAALAAGMDLALANIALDSEIDEGLDVPRQAAIAAARFTDELGLPRQQLHTASVVAANRVDQLPLVQAGKVLAVSRVASMMLQRDAGDL